MNDYFVEASVVIAGGLDSYEYFPSWGSFTAWFDVTRTELVGISDSAEIYVLEHEHALGVDCECVQYLTDHRPYWSNDIED